MTHRLEGLVALVTGGSSGIGRAVTERLAREGARVAFCGRRTSVGNQTEAEFRTQGLDVLFVEADVSDEEQMRFLVARTLEWGGKLDIGVNAAGMSPRRARLTEATAEAYEAVFSSNVKGTFFAMKHELRAMEPQKTGAIVNLSSVLGIKAADLNHSLYTASKHAVVGLTKTAALEEAPFGIRVNAVCPGVIETPIHATNAPSAEALGQLVRLHPLGRIGTPEEVADAIAWLVSPEASFVTGTILTVDGGAAL